MENISQSLFALFENARTRILEKLNTSLTYGSIILFVVFTSFVSVSMHRYVTRTLVASMTQPQHEEIKDAGEIPEESSVAITINRGDTLTSILSDQNLPRADIDKIINLVKNKNINFPIKAGKKITFEYEMKITENDDSDLAEETRTLTKIIMVLDKTNIVEIVRQNDDFTAKNIAIQLNKLITKSSVVIGKNFMSALKSIGLSTNSIIELVNSYSHQIDFQRQIQPTDTATVILEKFTNQNGDLSHYGKILYASLNLSGKEHKIYRYLNNNHHSFFSENGKSVKRSLLRTPVNIVRISSSYGNRIHPTMGFTKMHRGVDFAAPSGTPIYAAGNGIVTDIGWRSGYGNFVQIKHSANLSTAYAHASKFAKNLQKGSLVKQGQIIAYVGSTGRATGAHLHYEVKINGKHVNPMSIKTTPGTELTGAQLAKFQQFKKEINSLISKLDSDIEIAANNTNFVR
jgi:murein DD-endopeptidase MepM/ murein hydrolase activator NlpD